MQKLQNSSKVTRAARVRARDRMTESFSEAVSAAIERHQSDGYPIAKYDAAKKKAYLEYPSGKKRYVR